MADLSRLYIYSFFAMGLLFLKTKVPFFHMEPASEEKPMHAPTLTMLSWRQTGQMDRGDVDTQYVSSFHRDALW